MELSKHNETEGTWKHWLFSKAWQEEKKWVYDLPESNRFHTQSKQPETSSKFIAYSSEGQENDLNTRFLCFHGELTFDLVTVSVPCVIVFQKSCLHEKLKKAHVCSHLIKHLTADVRTIVTEVQLHHRPSTVTSTLPGIVGCRYKFQITILNNYTLHVSFVTIVLLISLNNEKVHGIGEVEPTLRKERVTQNRIMRDSGRKQPLIIW